MISDRPGSASLRANPLAEIRSPQGAHGGQRLELLDPLMRETEELSGVPDAELQPAVQLGKRGIVRLREATAFALEPRSRHGDGAQGSLDRPWEAHVVDQGSASSHRVGIHREGKHLADPATSLRKGPSLGDRRGRLNRTSQLGPVGFPDP